MDTTNLLWDSLRPSFRLEGSGAKRFLHGQTSADFNNFDRSTIVRSCWLTATGRVRALLEICLEDNVATVVVIAGDIKQLVGAFEQVIFPADKLKLISSRHIRRLQPIASLSDEISPEVMWLNEHEPLPAKFNNYKIASPSEIERWRLESRLPMSAGEVNGEYNPFELGLREWISLDKGCYLGQETLAKLHSKNILNKKLVFWRSKDLIETGEKLINPPIKDQKEVRGGFVTSSMNSLDSEGSFGLAIISKESFKASELFLSCNSRSVYLLN